MKLFKMI